MDEEHMDVCNSIGCLDHLPVTLSKAAKAAETAFYESSLGCILSILGCLFTLLSIGRVRQPPA